jgi:hypothetical protein
MLRLCKCWRGERCEDGGGDDDASDDHAAECREALPILKGDQRRVQCTNDP